MTTPTRNASGMQFRQVDISFDEEKREIGFIASDESTDRYGDIIRVSGWELENFKRNPVLLFAHASREPPIGGVPEVGVHKQKKQLLARAQFMPEGMYEFADLIWRMVVAKFLRAVSVGFMPTKMPNEIKDPETNRWTGGYEWVGQELLELSVVPVPANAEALSLAKSFNPRIVRRLFPTCDDGALAFHAARRKEIDILSLRAGG